MCVRNNHSPFHGYVLQCILDNVPKCISITYYTYTHKVICKILDLICFKPREHNQAIKYKNILHIHKTTVM